MRKIMIYFVLSIMIFGGYSAGVWSRTEIPETPGAQLGDEEMIDAYKESRNPNPRFDYKKHSSPGIEYEDAFPE